MSHAIDTGALHEKLFVLEHLAFGSRGYCDSNGLDTFGATGYLEPLSPSSFTKSVVSTYTIEIAVRLRILLDHAYTLDKPSTKKLEDQATTGLRISYNQKQSSNLGTSSLDLRETLNKVIHAEIVSVNLNPDNDGTSDTHYWDGQVQVEGVYNGKRWRHAIEIAPWCKACRRLLNALMRDDKLAGLGWNNGF